MAEFEFSGQHETEFEKSGYWMAIAGLLGIVVGVLQLLTGLTQFGTGQDPAIATGALIGGAIYIIFGVLLRRSGKAFKAIATSEGQDMEHLLRAVVSLKLVFRTMVVGIVVIIGLAFAGGIAAGLLAGAEG